MSDLYLDLMARAVSNDLHPELGHRVVGLARELVKAQGRPDNMAEIAKVMERVFHRGYLEAPVDPYASGQWYAKIAADPYTMTQPERIANVREAVETVLRENVPGAIVETGVWRGGLCIMMKAVLAAHNARRRVFVCDSFQGLPEISEGADAPLKLHENPLLSVSAEEVRENFRRFGLLDDDVIMVEGWFADTMPKLAERVRKIAVLRLDGDYYTSTREVIDPLYDRVSPGGFIIVDDYGCYQQARDAIHDFWGERGLKPEMIQVDWTCWYWRKEA